MRGNMICPYCGIEFEPKYETQKYCTQRHGRADNKRRRKIARRKGTPPIEYNKNCAVCGMGFATISPSSVCCSKACSKIHRRRTHDTRSGKRATNRKTLEYVYRFKIEHGCSKCPERRPVCLQFHHLDPSKKEFDISKAKSRGFDKVIKEISKCILLCGNCHAVEENGDGYRDADRPKGL